MVRRIRRQIPYESVKPEDIKKMNEDASAILMMNKLIKMELESGDVKNSKYLKDELKKNNNTLIKFKETGLMDPKYYEEIEKIKVEKYGKKNKK